MVLAQPTIQRTTFLLRKWALYAGSLAGITVELSVHCSIGPVDVLELSVDLALFFDKNLYSFLKYMRRYDF
jgi:hypothetical protein